MRKLKYLLVATIMSTTLLFGCGSEEEKDTTPLKELSAQELVDSVSKSEAMKMDSFEFTIDASVDVKSGTGDLASEVKADADAVCQVDIKNKMMKLDLDANVAGQKTEMEGYITADGATPTIYYSMNGMWFKMNLENEDVSNIFATTDSESNTVDFEQLTKYLLDSKVETKDNTYVLSGKIDLEKIAAEENEEYSEMLKGVSINLSVAVNSDYSFKSFEITLDKFATELMGTPIEINNVSLKISMDKYNSIEKITIPEEALNAAEMDMSGLM